MIRKTMIAIAIVMVLMGGFTFAAPGASASCKVVDIVETEKVSFSYDVPAELLDTLDEVCPDLIPYYDDWAGMQLTIVVDGTVHLNLKVWEKDDCTYVKVHAFWRGTITALLDGEEVLEIDIKNLQFLVHVSLTEDCCMEQVIVNVHLKGELATLTEMIDPIEIDLDTHVMVRYVNGRFWVKAWLPDFIGLELFDI